MIKDVKRYHAEEERRWAYDLRRLTYTESVRMAEALLSCGLLEQVRLRGPDAPVALRYLLHR